MILYHIDRQVFFFYGHANRRSLQVRSRRQRRLCIRDRLYGTDPLFLPTRVPVRENLNLLAISGNPWKKPDICLAGPSRPLVTPVMVLSVGMACWGINTGLIPMSQHLPQLALTAEIDPKECRRSPVDVVPRASMALLYSS